MSLSSHDTCQSTALLFPFRMTANIPCTITSIGVVLRRVPASILHWWTSSPWDVWHPYPRINSPVSVEVTVDTAQCGWPTWPGYQWTKHVCVSPSAFSQWLLFSFLIFQPHLVLGVTDLIIKGTLLAASFLCLTTQLRRSIVAPSLASPLKENSKSRWKYFDFKLELKVKTQFYHN